MESTSSNANEAVEKALDKYSDTVRRICFMYLKSEADVEDIFQRSIVK